ncbi:MAG: protein-glutamate O-methyltransferase CheR [Planctomycetes bacterium]|nr:protein-glutamate O-methyltransferase CheR [Planctomycetota bacterium]
MNLNSISAHQVLADPFFPQLKGFLIQASGLAYYQDKDEEMANRVASRLSHLGLEGCGHYLALVRDEAVGGRELDALMAELTIGETYFFRHQELFDALRDLAIPERIGQNRPARRLRIWSAGCASGAEPYSICILLDQEFGGLLADWDVSIVATDVNRAALAKARQGHFEEWAFRSTSEEIKRRYFLPSGKAWTILPKFQSRVSFQYHNLVQHPFPSLIDNLAGFDLILCRNVMIYFSAEVIRRLVKQFHECLVEGGWLLVGHAEPNPEFFSDFRPVLTPGAVLYRRVSGPSAGQPEGLSPAGLPAQPATPAFTSGCAGSSSPVVPAPFQFPAVSFSMPSLLTWSPPILKAENPPDPLAAKPLTLGQEGASRVGLTSPSPSDAVSAGPEEALAEVRSLADQARWEEAATACSRAMKGNRLEPRLHFYVALVQEQLGQVSEAEESLRKALYLDRNFVLAHYHLGILLQRRSDAGRAGRCFENALRILSAMSPDAVFEDADGATAGSLAEMTRMHLEVLGPG